MRSAWGYGIAQSTLIMKFRNQSEICEKCDYGQERIDPHLKIIL